MAQQGTDKAITKPSLPRRVSRLPFLILHPWHHHSLHDDGVLVAVHDGRLASSRSTSPKAQADYASVPSAPSAECCMHLDPTWSHSPGHLLQCSAHSQRCGAGSLAASAYDKGVQLYVSQPYVSQALSYPIPKITGRKLIKWLLDDTRTRLESKLLR